MLIIEVGLYATAVIGGLMLGWRNVGCSFPAFALLIVGVLLLVVVANNPFWPNGVLKACVSALLFGLAWSVGFQLFMRTIR